MTVCVAAIGERGKAIALVSDKALTYGDDKSPKVQSDTGIRKVLPIGETGWNAMYAGDPGFADKVIRHAAAQLDCASAKLGPMMDQMKRSYQAIRAEVVTDTILQPRFLTKELLTARSADLLPLPDDYFVGVSNDAAGWDDGCDLLVCGFDKDGPHIFLINEPGASDSEDSVGFWAIGMGADASIGRLLWLETDRKASLDNILYDAFDAKAHAEQVQSVGYDWDGLLMARNYQQHVKGKAYRLVERVFECSTRSPYWSKLSKREMLPSDWKTQLRQYTDDFLRKAEKKQKSKMVGRKANLKVKRN